MAGLPRPRECRVKPDNTEVPEAPRPWPWGMSQRLERLRRRHGREPVTCRDCRWHGDQSQCDLAPVHRPVGAYALPGAAWRGQRREICPACGGQAIEEASWCPDCAGWTCVCTPDPDETNENRPGP